MDDMHKNGGLAPVDIEQFWRDQDEAAADPFGAHIKQVPFDFVSGECVYDELGIPEDYRLLSFPEHAQWRYDTFRRYNDKAEKIVGRRLLPEIDPATQDPTLVWPRLPMLYDLFEAKNEWEGGAGGSWWLKQAAHSPEELSSLLDRVEERINGDMRSFVFPENWDDIKKRMFAAGKHIPLYRHQRGPCTFACSIFGAEDLLMLYYDDEDLFRRFSDVIGRAIVALASTIDAEEDPAYLETQRYWSWADDNSCLFNPELYEAFAMPIHRRVFARFAPDQFKDRRMQHSDSAMGHLLPLLSEVNLTWTNFGPTLTVEQIRKYCPQAIIRGQLAPFTLSRSKHEQIVYEFLRDYEQAKEKRGLFFTTAGSINNGSSLQSMRLVMSVIQQYGRY